MGSFREPPNQQRVRRLKQSSKGDLYQFSLGVPVQSYEKSLNELITIVSSYTAVPCAATSHLLYQLHLSFTAVFLYTVQRLYFYSCRVGI